MRHKNTVWTDYKFVIEHTHHSTKCACFLTVAPSGTSNSKWLGFFLHTALNRFTQTVFCCLHKGLLKTVTSIGHATVDQLVHQIVIALSGGSLMVVEVRWDVIRGQLFEDLLLQGGLFVVALRIVAAVTVQNLNTITQVLAAGHAVVVCMVTIERERIHYAGVSGVVQDALYCQNHTTKQISGKSA